jgi:colanic acid biosynthesis glycosyl transferase WcaI
MASKHSSGSGPAPCLRRGGIPRGRVITALAPRAPHLLVVNRFYWPDHSAVSQILTDLCEHAAENGFRVTVITSCMLYDAPRQHLPSRDSRRGVTILRMSTTRRGRNNLPGRALDYLSFHALAFASLLMLVRRGDLVLATTDPPLISLPAAIAARLRGAEFANWLLDVFPEVATALGVRWTGGPIGALLRKIRNVSLRRASANVVISDRMAELMAAEGVRAETLQIIPNWSESSVHPIPRGENRLRRDLGLADKFVIGYSGNLGRAHLAESVADLVQRTAGLPDVAWLFIGGGAGLNAVKAAAQRVASTVVFLPYQPREVLSESLSASDLHLVSLDPACEGLILPSKLYGIMAAGRAVLSLGDRDGAVAREVRRADMGMALDVSEPETWRDAVAGLASHPLADVMGVRARMRFETAYRPEVSLASWLHVLEQLVPGHEAVAGRPA